MTSNSVALLTAITPVPLYAGSVVLGYVCTVAPLSWVHVNASPDRITWLSFPNEVYPWPTEVVTVIIPLIWSYWAVDTPNGGA